MTAGEKYWMVTLAAPAPPPSRSGSSARARARPGSPPWALLTQPLDQRCGCAKLRRLEPAVVRDPRAAGDPVVGHAPVARRPVAEAVTGVLRKDDPQQGAAPRDVDLLVSRDQPLDLLPGAAAEVDVRAGHEEDVSRDTRVDAPDPGRRRQVVP